MKTITSLLFLLLYSLMTSCKKGPLPRTQLEITVVYATDAIAPGTTVELYGSFDDWVHSANIIGSPQGTDENGKTIYTDSHFLPKTPLRGGPYYISAYKNRYTNVGSTNYIPSLKDNIKNTFTAIIQ